MSRNPAPTELAEHLPDLPQWVETRWILRSPGCSVISGDDSGSGFLALHQKVPLGAVVGRPAPVAFEVLRRRSPPFELVVQEEDAAYVRETFEGFRRRGYARACFEALDRFMAKRGKQPVWGATEDNIGSMAMARSLGFAPVASLAVLETVRNQTGLRDSLKV